MTETTPTLSEDAALYVMEALRNTIVRLERDIETGGKLLADPKLLTVNAREYFTKRHDEEKRYVEEVKAFLKKVRYGEI